MQSIAQGKPPVRLSEQEGIDCVTDAWGCDGGWSEWYWAWSRDNGTMLEKHQPYEARKNFECRKQHQKNMETGERVASRVQSSHYINGCKAINIARELQNGPLVASVEVDDCWNLYKGGILTEADGCKNENLNHQVVIVGLDQSPDGLWYWIVQNSWSEYWGDHGLVYIEVTNDAMGVSAINQYP